MAAESLDHDFASPWIIRGAILAVLGLFYLIYTREATPLRKIPGPFLASITRLWVLNKQRGYKRPLVDMKLHKKYGSIVRIAPNEVMISSPKAFRTVYGAGSNFRKGDFYVATGECGRAGRDNLDFLGEQDREKYRIQRRAVGPAYTEKAMYDVEDKIDTAVKKDINIMHKRAGQSVDLDIFFNMFASDCLSMATFSKAKDLVERGEDDGSIHFIHAAWKYIHIVGYLPEVHRMIMYFSHSGPISGISSLMIQIAPVVNRGRMRGKPSTLPTQHPFAFPMSQIQERFSQRDAPSSPSKNDSPNDIAAKLLDLQAEKGILKDLWVQSMCMTNYGAGVETIAVTVGSLINNVVSHLGCQERIQKELDDARKSGKLSNPPKLREMKENLPYLNACLYESQRLHPVVGMPLQRVVPEGGCELEGKYLPGGTRVGINSWVLNRNKSLYGEDADIWRPDRWLEFSAEKLRYLETYNVSFGTGARSCPGKHLAQAVYTKMIPMIFLDFEWSFTDPTAEKVLQCTFSTRYVGLMMQWKSRTNSV